MPEKAMRDWKLMGSSYIAAIACAEVDEPSFLRPIEIWKAMRGELKQDISGIPRIRWGNLVESAIIKSYEQDFNVKLEQNPTLYDPINPLFCATPDGINWEKGILVECKNVDRYMAFKWDEGVPAIYYIQVQWQLMVANYQGKDIIKFATIRALFGGNEHKDFQVEYDQTFCENLRTVGENFYNDYVVTGTPPPPDASQAYREFLLEKYPAGAVQPEKIYIVNDDDEIDSAIAKLAFVKEQLKKLEYDADECKNIIRNAIGDAYGIRSKSGKHSWYPVKGRVSPSGVLKAVEANWLDTDEKRDQFLKWQLENTGTPSRTFR